MGSIQVEIYQLRLCFVFAVLSGRRKGHRLNPNPTAQLGPSHISSAVYSDPLGISPKFSQFVHALSVYSHVATVAGLAHRVAGV